MDIPQPLPPFQTLRAFVAVAKLRSFTKAAASLHITQTAVSHQIAQLENWISGRLLIRDRQKIELTSLGAKLLPVVSSSLGELQGALDVARRANEGRRLLISTTPEFASQWLTPSIPRFCQAHPEIDFSIVVEYRRPRLDLNEVDAAIWLGRGPAAMDAEQLTFDQEFAVCSPKLASTLPNRNALLAASLLRYEGARHTVLDWRRWYALIYGEDEAKSPQVIPQLDLEGGPLYPTFAAMLDACKRGEGFALVRDSLVINDLETGQLVRCFNETIDSDLQYHLAVSPSERDRPDVAAFRFWLRQELGDQR